MNYGYEPTKHDDVIAADLSELLSFIAEKYPDWPKEVWKRPYVEVDNLYRGVRIRKITYLTEAQENELIEKADAIYAKYKVSA
jgi:hypothetical protein